ncbi:MAG: class I tRNA ligase family protein, partial [Acidobacteria bacterium]|nr:class I tRNA ligase family protein [Acidobacteriota bacterium]
PGLHWPADLYVEGHDQYRGWFQSSLLVGVVTHGASPYRAVVTHGHVVDAAGKKMSKSLGNVVAPQALIKEFGADTLRLWVAAVDFREDLPISKEIIARTAEPYRKIRNTVRFLLSNLAGFDPARDSVPLAELRPLDAHFLRRGKALAGRVAAAYESFEFHAVYHALNNFCNVDLSALYLHILKDRLYCSHPADPARRSAQWALYRLARMLTTVMAPILTFTADEAWEFLPGDKPASVHLAPFDLLADVADDDGSDACFARLWPLVDEINKLLETRRQAGDFGKSLEAAAVLGGDRTALDADLAAAGVTIEEVCIVSQAISGGEGTASASYPGLRVAVERAAGTPCPRCWQVVAPAGHPDHPEL